MLAGMGSAPANGGRLQQRQSDGSLRDVIVTSDLIALFGGASKKIRLGGGRWPRDDVCRELGGTLPRSETCFISYRLAQVREGAAPRLPYST